MKCRECGKEVTEDDEWTNICDVCDQKGKWKWGDEIKMNMRPGLLGICYSCTHWDECNQASDDGEKFRCKIDPNFVVGQSL